MARDYYRRGEYKATCDRCGFRFWASQLRKEWDGVMVCSRCWEPRNAQELVRPIKDDSAVPWSRPETPDVFVPTSANVDIYVLGAFMCAGALMG